MIHEFSASSTFEFSEFRDATKLTYVAIVYLKTLNPIMVMLVAANVSCSLQCIELPSLEHCSALLLSQLIHMVQDALLDTVN